MSKFTALRIHKTDSGTAARFDTISQDDLTAGNVIIRVSYSGVNYKDALAVSGKGGVMRTFPRTAGIDLSGIVESSSDPAYQPGAKVLVTGCNIGETLDGGFAEFARVPAEAVVPLPATLSLFDAMALGTAGFTAAMALRRMLDNHQTPDKGPIAVTGPTGGVGSIAIAVFARAGFNVAAITGKKSLADYLRGLGASDVIDRTTLDLGSKAMEKAVWGGAVDNLGGETLTYLTRTVRHWGNIACIGLAQSTALNTTVIPLILRGVSLLGIHSVEVPRAWRLALWNSLADEWKLEAMERTIVHDVIPLQDVPRACEELIRGENHGRYVVRIGRE